MSLGPLVHLQVEIPEEYAGWRLDAALAQCFPDYSRSRLTQWIKQGWVQLNGRACCPKEKLQGRENIRVEAHLPCLEVRPEAIALEIVYEDEGLLVVNKPAGLVVHPGSGNWEGTLVNALLHYDPLLAHLPRAGIVHRLDKDTTGLLLVAKQSASYSFLISAMQERKMKKTYLGLVGTEVIAGNTIEAPIGRHPVQRICMAVVPQGKPAVTHYRCLKRYRGFTLLEIGLETGRTHQIRVHLAHKGMPLVGDKLYGWRYRVPSGASSLLQENIRCFSRQALHAWRLEVPYPNEESSRCWEAPLPEDFKNLLFQLEEKRECDGNY